MGHPGCCSCKLQKHSHPVRDYRIAGFLPSKSPWVFYPPQKKQAKLPMMTVRGILYLLQMVVFFFFFGLFSNWLWTSLKLTARWVT